MIQVCSGLQMSAPGWMAGRSIGIRLTSGRLRGGAGAGAAGRWRGDVRLCVVGGRISKQHLQPRAETVPQHRRPHLFAMMWKSGCDCGVCMTAQKGWLGLRRTIAPSSAACSGANTAEGSW